MSASAASRLQGLGLERHLSITDGFFYPATCLIAGARGGARRLNPRDDMQFHSQLAMKKTVARLSEPAANLRPWCHWYGVNSTRLVGESAANKWAELSSDEHNPSDMFRVLISYPRFFRCIMKRAPWFGMDEEGVNCIALLGKWEGGGGLGTLDSFYVQPIWTSS